MYLDGHTKGVSTSILAGVVYIFNMQPKAQSKINHQLSSTDVLKPKQVQVQTGIRIWNLFFKNNIRI